MNRICDFKSNVARQLSVLSGMTQVRILPTGRIWQQYNQSTAATGIQDTFLENSRKLCKKTKVVQVYLENIFIFLEDNKQCGFRTKITFSSASVYNTRPHGTCTYSYRQVCNTLAIFRFLLGKRFCRSV